MATIGINSYDLKIKNGGRKVAFLVTTIFHVALFTVLYTGNFSAVIPEITESAIEIVFNNNSDSKAGGWANATPNRNQPAIYNIPGNTAPESARIAESNQSTAPLNQPDARESALSDVGDIEQATTPTDREINRRALFQSTNTGTEDGQATSNVRDNSLFPGVGNSNESTRTASTPLGIDHRQSAVASLSGRSVMGSVPLPSYNTQTQGRVVVEVTVDQNGKVTKATAIGRGSTVQDAQLWRAAETAALKASFNVKKDAPIFQTGTITYNFILK